MSAEFRLPTPKRDMDDGGVYSGGTRTARVQTDRSIAELRRVDGENFEELLRKLAEAHAEALRPQNTALLRQILVRADALGITTIDRGRANDGAEAINFLSPDTGTYYSSDSPSARVAETMTQFIATDLLSFMDQEHPRVGPFSIDATRNLRGTSSYTASYGLDVPLLEITRPGDNAYVQIKGVTPRLGQMLVREVLDGYLSRFGEVQRNPGSGEKYVELPRRPQS